MNKQMIKEEQILKQYIKRLVRESLENMAANYNFEEKGESDNGEESGESKNVKRRRLQVQKFFSQDGINPAAYAYKLFNVEPVEGDDTNDMKNARSLFMKKLHNEKNTDGYPYEFTSEEVNSLYSMISGNGVS